MTRGEIALTLIVFTLFGVVFTTWAVRILFGVPEWTPATAAWAFLWPGVGILMVDGIVLAAYVQAFRELRRRRSKQT
jgi:hypothetical protein